MAEKLEHNFFEKLADHFVKRECVKANEKIVTEFQTGLQFSFSEPSSEDNISNKIRAVSMNFEHFIEDNPPEIRTRSASCSQKTNTPEVVTNLVNITSESNSCINKSPKETKKPDKKRKKRKGPVEISDFENDPFLQTLKTLQLEQKEPSSLEIAKEKLTTFMREGSAFLKKELPRLAMEKYKNAIDMILEGNAELYDLKEMDFVTLQYALGHCYIETLNYFDICRGIEIFVEIKKVHDSKFPTIYYALGSAYYKLNRFKVATEHLKTGFEFLDNKIPFESHPWPGTNNIIRLTTRDGLKENLINLLQLCQVYYLPDANCKYAQCLSINPHIIPSRNIFHSDPDFSGLIVVYCEENCKIEYHTFCWKNYKESLNSVEKLCDKNLLGKDCPTFDCFTNYNKKSCIVRVEIYGEDSNLKSQCFKENTSDQSSNNKKSKKKRLKLTSINAPEKVKKKVKRERTVSDTSHEKNRNEPNTAQQPVNDLSHRLHKLKILRDTNFNCDVEQCWDPSKRYYGQCNYGSWNKFPISKHDTEKIRATKDFIFSYFSDVLIENGPMDKQFIVKKWLKDFEDAKDLHTFLAFYNNDIIQFLLTSHQFVLIEDTLCHAKDVSDAYNVTKTVLTESLLFVLNDCPTETLHSSNHNIQVNLDNNEMCAVEDVYDLFESTSENIRVQSTFNKIENENIGMQSTSNQIENENVGMQSTFNKIENENVGMQSTFNKIENENVGMQSTFNKIENDNIQDNNENIQNIHNYNQSLLDEVTDCESKAIHPETVNTVHANHLQHAEVEFNGFFMAPGEFTDLSGDRLSSHSTTDENSYLTSAGAIYQMETFENSVQINANDLNGEVKSKVIEIFLTEVELLFKNEFQTIDHSIMERLKHLMYAYTKMNCKCSSLRDILRAFNDQIEVSGIDKRSMDTTVQEIKLNVLRAGEEIETMMKTLTEKLCIQDLQLKNLINLIDKLKNKFAAIEKMNEISQKEKISFYRKKCESNITYSKILLQSEKARIEAGMENVVEKLKISNDLLNIIDHLQGNNYAANQSTEYMAKSNTSNLFSTIDEISDYLDVGLQKLLSKTVNSYNIPNYSDAVENTVDFDLYQYPEHTVCDQAAVTSRNISDVSCYSNPYFNNIGEYYNLHRNLATLPLQERRCNSPIKEENKNLTSCYSVKPVGTNSLDQNIVTQPNTLMGKASSLAPGGMQSRMSSASPTPSDIYSSRTSESSTSSGTRNVITSESTCHMRRLPETKMHQKPTQLFPTDFVNQSRTMIWSEDRSGYSHLIDRLLYKFVTWERSEMEALLMSIRERKNGLSGLKLVEIFHLVEQEVQERNKIYGGTMGAEKFGGTAWGGIKTNKAWSNPSNETQDDCVICMDQMTDDSTSLQCKHSFHTKCIKDWLSTKTVCPICQALALLNEEYPPLM